MDKIAQRRQQRSKKFNKQKKENDILNKNNDILKKNISKSNLDADLDADLNADSDVDTNNSIDITDIKTKYLLDDKEYNASMFVLDTIQKKFSAKFGDNSGMAKDIKNGNSEELTKILLTNIEQWIQFWSDNKQVIDTSDIGEIIKSDNNIEILSVDRCKLFINEVCDKQIEAFKNDREKFMYYKIMLDNENIPADKVIENVIEKVVEEVVDDIAHITNEEEDINTYIDPIIKEEDKVYIDTVD